MAGVFAGGGGGATFPSFEVAFGCETLPDLNPDALVAEYVPEPQPGFANPHSIGVSLTGIQPGNDREDNRQTSQD